MSDGQGYKKNIKNNNGATENNPPSQERLCPSPSAPFLKQAELIADCNFYLQGYGWFCLTCEEAAYILELSYHRQEKELKQFYEELSEKRLD